MITSFGWSRCPRTIPRYLLLAALEKSKACRQSGGFQGRCLSLVCTRQVALDPQRKRCIDTQERTGSMYQPSLLCPSKAKHPSASQQGDPLRPAQWFGQSRIAWQLESTLQGSCLKRGLGKRARWPLVHPTYHPHSTLSSAPGKDSSSS